MISGSLLRGLCPAALAACALGCAVETAGLREPAGEDAGTDADSPPPVDAGGDIDGGIPDDDAGDPIPDAGTDAPTVSCVPGASRCSADETFAIVCDESGMREADLGCAAGCDPSTGACRSIPTCDLTVEADLSPGDERMFSLCGGGADFTPQTTSACEFTMWGEDRMFRIVLDRPHRVWLDLKDVDAPEPIDTVLYVRTDCAEPTSQIECHDDIACEDADPDLACGGGTQRRQSRIEMDLGPGAYWVVADSFDYNDRGTHFTCGEVLLRYRLLD